MLDQNPSPPIIPRRPKKQQELSFDAIEPAKASSSESINNIAVDNAEGPMIPKRPTKTTTTELEGSTTPIIPRRPAKGNLPKESQSVSEATLETSDVKPEAVQTSQNRETEGKEEALSNSLLLQDDNSILNSQREGADDTEADLDGDRTPGNSNTKITFKDDIDDEAAAAGAISDVSSFNDDVETVSQEKEDEEELHRQQTSEQPEQIASSTDEHTADIKEAENKENDGHDDLENKDSMENSPETDPISDSTVKRADSIEGDVPDLDEPPVVPLMPKIPSRPVSHISTTLKSGDDSSVENKPDSTSSTDDKTAADVTEKDIDVPGTESADSKPAKPIIPSRPKKNKPEPVAILKNLDSPSEASSKPKAPPPKPKKLSSKIAAFQQMFNEGEKPPSPETSSPQITPVVGGNVLRGKLSNDKMKFAESLKGFMGRGIPLPGMANPNLSVTTDDSLEPEETSSPAAQETATLNTSSQRTRARNPKGKRLPKSLKEPVAIDVKPRFQIAIHDLWEFKFEKTAEPELENVTRTDDSPILEKDTTTQPELPDTEVLVEGDDLNGGQQLPIINTLKSALEEDQAKIEEEDEEIKSDEKFENEHIEKVQQHSAEDAEEKEKEQDSSLKVDSTAECAIPHSIKQESVATGVRGDAVAEDGPRKGDDVTMDVISEYQVDESDVKDTTADITRDPVAHTESISSPETSLLGAEKALNGEEDALVDGAHDKTDASYDKELLEVQDE